MASATPSTESTLEVRRMFTAPREKVFAAWTERNQLEKWMCNPSGKNVTKYLEFDLREGGNYVLELLLPDGNKYLNKGTYKLVQPPEKLVFSWAWEKFDPAGNKFSELHDTWVTVEFLARGQWTEVVLKHDFLPDAAARESHQKGWIGCLEVLAQQLNA